MSERLRCAWEVYVGLIPGQPLPKLTRRWLLTEEDWDGGSESGRLSFATARDLAYAYAKTTTDPNVCNWVRVDFIWL